MFVYLPCNVPLIPSLIDVAFMTKIDVAPILNVAPWIKLSSQL